MSLIVQKYGGTSVGNTERINNVAKRILDTQKAGNQVVAVVSAMAGVTNRLIEMANDGCSLGNRRTNDHCSDLDGN